MRKTALITGAAGFVGRHLVPLLESEYDVFGVDPKYKPDVRYSAYFRERFENLVTYRLFPPFDVVVHLAANILPIDERLAFGINAYKDIALDLAMANYIEERPPKKAFIYMSSCAVDSAGSDPYGWVKATGEKVFKRIYQMGIPVVILRPFSGYGSDQEEMYPFPAILKRVLEGQNPVKVWGSGYQVRDWIHVEDLARAIVWAIDAAPHGQPLDIGTGVGTQMSQLARIMAKLAFPDRPLEIEADDSKPESSPSRIAENVIARAYGFEAKIALEEGIRTAIEYSRAKDVQAARA